MTNFKMNSPCEESSILENNSSNLSSDEERLFTNESLSGSTHSDTLFNEIRVQLNTNPEYDCDKRLESFLKPVYALEAFTQLSSFTEDVLYEYLKYLEIAHPNVLFVKPRLLRKLELFYDTQLICLLEREAAKERDAVFFILQEEEKYCILCYEAKRATIYHYYLPLNKNNRLVKLLWQRIEAYFNINHFVRVRCETKHSDVIFFVIECILKKLKNLNGLEFKEADSDALRMDVTYAYVEAKLKTAEQFLPSGFERIAEV